MNNTRPCGHRGYTSEWDIISIEQNLYKALSAKSTAWSPRETDVISPNEIKQNGTEWNIKGKQIEIKI